MLDFMMPEKHVISIPKKEHETVTGRFVSESRACGQENSIEDQRGTYPDPQEQKGPRNH